MANQSIFVDSFDRPNNTNISALALQGAAYTEVTEAWEIVSGKLKTINLAPHLATVDAPVMNSADYYAQAIVFTDPTAGSGIGLILRYQDVDNYYYAVINTISQTVSIRKRVGGSNSTLGSFGGGYVIGTSYTLKFQAIGTTLKAFVNGTERVSVTDSDITAVGKPGLWTDYGLSTFDNLVISGDMTKTPLPVIGEDYSQPPIVRQTANGWAFNGIDIQVVTKSDGWNQDATKRNNEFDALISLGANYVAIGVPYDNLTKYTNYVNGARAKGLKVFHRAHWNAWEGDNNIPAGVSRLDYLEDFYRFAVANPGLYAAGDLLGVCVEPNNANDHGNYTFRTPETSGGAFQIAKFNQFIKDQVKYANVAMTAIGLGGQVYTWAISPSLSLVDLDGQTLDSGDGGNSAGIDNAFVRDYLGGVFAIDHYITHTVRSTDNYGAKLSSDLDKLHLAFPDCQIMIAEFGYPTNTNLSDREQEAVYNQALSAIQSKGYVIGVNCWNHMGSEHASLYRDSSGTIITDGRLATGVVRRAYNSGNAAYGKRTAVSSRPTSGTRPASGNRLVSGIRPSV